MSRVVLDRAPSVSKLGPERVDCGPLQLIARRP
jgi:hypothetical protein